MVKGVHETLANIDKVVPGYKGQGYEIAGFGWFQGHKDSGSTKEDYEKCLVNLINDLRKEFKAPKMKAVVATVGFHGYRLMSGPWKGVWEAQMAVGDPKQHPEFRRLAWPRSIPATSGAKSRSRHAVRTTTTTATRKPTCWWARRWDGRWCAC